MDDGLNDVDGLEDGTDDFNTLGPPDGFAEGITDGFSVVDGGEVSVGFKEGNIDNEGRDEVDGLPEGLLDGIVDGRLEGFNDGINVVDGVTE